MRVDGSLPERFSARAIQAAEWALRPLVPGTGEEMVLRAVKPRTSADQVAAPKG